MPAVTRNELRNRLVNAQSEYIELLNNELNKFSQLIITGEYTPRKEDIEQGEKLRAKIRQIKGSLSIK